MFIIGIITEHLAHQLIQILLTRAGTGVYMPGIEGRNVFATKKGGDIPREFAEPSAKHLYPE